MVKDSDSIREILLQHPFLTNYLCGCTASCVAEVFTFPFDILKTRSQLQGELYSISKSDLKRSFVSRGLGIIRNEGILRLWHGLSPALYRHLTYSGLRISIYKQLKGLVDTRTKKDELFPLWKACAVGFVAGGIAQAVASPFDMVKIQMQMDGLRIMQGKEPRVKNAYHGLTTIYKHHGGLPGLWKGWLPNAQKSALVNLADIGVYDTAKHYLIKSWGTQHMFVIQCMSSFLSGLAAAMIGTPADTVKARVMNQPLDRSGRGLYYKGSVDCLLKTIKNEGLLAMYKGFFPYWFKLFPFTIIFWNVLEFNRKLMGVQAF